MTDRTKNQFVWPKYYVFINNWKYILTENSLTIPELKLLPNELSACELFFAFWEASMYWPITIIGNSSNIIYFENWNIKRYDFEEVMIKVCPMFSTPWLEKSVIKDKPAMKVKSNTDKTVTFEAVDISICEYCWQKKKKYKDINARSCVNEKCCMGPLKSIPPKNNKIELLEMIEDYPPSFWPNCKKYSIQNVIENIIRIADFINNQPTWST